MEKEWLKNLKIGDKVAYECGRYGRIDYCIVTVEKITPTGIIKTSDGKSWSNEGRERGAEKSTWNTPYRLQLYTDKIQDYVARKQAIKYIGESDLNKLPTDKLIVIAGIIKTFIEKEGHDE